MSQIKKFNLFLEGMKARDLSSIPGKLPGERNYLADVTARAKERMGISGEREGDMGSIHRAAGPLMTEMGRSQSLSRGYEKQLEELAYDVIYDLYNPLIEAYKIKLDIKFASGNDIRRMIDAGYAKELGNKPSDIENKTPVVKARGVDFSMLIHEAVKGIWRVLSMRSVPKIDVELAKTIEKEFNLMDEPDDWKYGPEIAADLRDFINENPKTDSYKNVREEVWIYMVDPNNISDDKFLSLMKGILSKSPEARRDIDRIIDIVIRGIEKRDEYLRQMEEYEIKKAAWEKRQAERAKQGTAKPQIPAKQEKVVIDYSKMTQRELNDELSKALDDRDMETVKIISQYLQ